MYHKTEIVNVVDAKNNKRIIVGFVGGHDRCDERYVTPLHPTRDHWKNLEK